uniref:Uncharacterized protein n=1 Tax=Helianthus annuus TaxID=4232 RepID=A0A251S2N4_HELAN
MLVIGTLFGVVRNLRYISQSQITNPTLLPHYPTLDSSHVDRSPPLSTPGFG